MKKLPAYLQFFVIVFLLILMIFVGIEDLLTEDKLSRSIITIVSCLILLMTIIVKTIMSMKKNKISFWKAICINHTAATLQQKRSIADLMSTKCTAGLRASIIIGSIGLFLLVAGINGDVFTSYRDPILLLNILVILIPAIYGLGYFFKKDNQ